MTRILIIGGGAIGLSAAWHLAKRDAGRITLLERNTLTSGTSWHAAGIVGPLRATPNMTWLASRALDVFPALERETGMATGYHRTGGYWLARDPSRMAELHRIADLGVTQGLHPEIISPHQIDLPHLDLSHHIGALAVPEDANVNPVDLCMAYAKAARSRGVTILEDTRVSALVKDGNRIIGVTLADGTQMQADVVVLATGAWSRELAATAGVALPLQAVEHMYVVTEPIPDLPKPFPVIRDLDRGIYVKGDTGKLVIGGFERDAKLWNPQGPEGDRPFLELPEDWDQFAPFMQAALDLIPALEDCGIQHFMNGPESFTADTKPLVGLTGVDGLFVAAGMNSVGVMSSAGVGAVLADWIADGHPPRDLWEIDVLRADPASADPGHLAHRMKEAVADQFALHAPFKQPKHGRGLRRSALHDAWADQGAVFGVTGGWERGLWYAKAPAERFGTDDVEAQRWWMIAAREAAHLAQGTVLLDLSPFAKLRVTCPVAELNHLSTADLDVAGMRSVYTQLLNPRGGIEMDVTVTRQAVDVFDITSGAATRWRDLAFLRRALPTARIEDLTEASCVIGVMGGGGFETLRGLSEDWPRMRFGDVAEVTIAGQPALATRRSFIGEAGVELTIANAAARPVFDALIAAGAQPMGHLTLDGLRLEKGFRHWGHDIGPTVTPIEAGLGWCIDWSHDFVGKAALLDQRDAGPSRRLILMEIADRPLMLHDEPVFEAGRHVGFTTSGGLGPRTGLSLALAMVNITPGETPAETNARRFEVAVAGKLYAATPLRDVPFDPTHERMRG